MSLIPGRTAVAPASAEAQPAREISLAHQPQSAHGEQLRALRTELLLRLPTEGGHSLAVVSPSHGEGRSRLVAELAVGFAQLGAPTLLVDADLRRPRQHELFGIKAEAGLAQMLAGAPAPMHSVAGLPALHVLPAGLAPGNALELLSTPTFAELLRGWRSRYRHVLLDTTAAASGADSLVVALAAGSVLPVSRSNRTAIPDWKAFMTRLATTRAAVLGGVLHDF